MSQPEFPKKIADNVTMYAADPIVYLVSDFLNDDECEARSEERRVGKECER